MKELNLKDVISFGKYKGSTIKKILSIDPSYLVWANDLKIIKLEDSIYNKSVKLKDEIDSFEYDDYYLDSHDLH